ncbi:outer membrane protein assembly factor BamC [Roseateles sp. BYS180W]|uniref:Outer membrane protein assembly factor BamC n=1 Tax=Roseateles rivi TaxID=3299028 RepID=A0ABW7FSU0_9BURK
MTPFDSNRAPLTPVRLACLTLLAASLAGCSALDGVLGSDKVDYRTGAKQSTGLEVPPDLTQLNQDQRTPAQKGPISASEMQRQAAEPAQRNAGTSLGSVAPAQAGEVKLQRAGEQRWLSTPLPPEQVWTSVRSFWTDVGFEISKENPQTGTLETSWAENRAKLPQDVIRRTIGSVLDSFYSTGERDMYRTRVERNAQGGSDIFISHRGLQEVYTSAQREQTVWQPRPSDPMLEAEMTSRLMLRLGGTQEAAKAVLAAAPSAATKTTVLGGPQIASTPAANRPLSQVPDTLQVAEGFDGAWRRVAQSLDRHGFTIEDRDRKQGLFFLRYADPTQVGKEEPNFFVKLFTGAKNTTAARYRVAVKSEGNVSTVSVLDEAGKLQTNEQAKRILSLLMDDLR